MLVRLPSGFSFHARTWELGDQGELLSDIDDDNKVLAISMLRLAAQPGGVEDPGPYPFKSGGDVDWGLVTNADITVANFMIRIETDPDVVLQIACTKCGSLPQGDGIEVHLPDIEVFPPSEAGLSSIQSESPVSLSLTDKEGKEATVYLHALRGKHLAGMTRAIRQEESEMLVIQTCVSISRIEVAGRDKPITGLAAIRKYYSEQSWAFGNKIDETLDELYGGADATVNFRCDRLGCMREQEAPLPLDPHFYGLSPKKKRKGGLKLSAVSHSTGMTTPKVSSTSSPDSPTPPTSPSEASKRPRKRRSG